MGCKTLAEHSGEQRFEQSKPGNYSLVLEARSQRQTAVRFLLCALDGSN